MDYTDAEITAALDEVTTKLSAFDKSLGTLQTENEFDLVRAQFHDALIAEPDATFYLIKLSADRINDSITSMTKATAEIKTVIQGMGHKPNPSTPDLTRLDNIEGHLRAMKTEAGTTAQARRLSLIETNIADFATSTGTRENASPILRKPEAQVLVASQLSTVLESYDNVIEWQSQLDQVIPEYKAGLRTQAISKQVDRGGDIVTESRAHSTSPRDSTLKLIAMKTILSNSASPPDPLTAKVTTPFDPSGVSTKAQVFGTGNAPFNLVPGDGDLDVTANGVQQDWDVPRSTQATLETPDFGTVSLVSAGAALTTPNSGNYDLTIATTQTVNVVDTVNLAVSTTNLPVTVLAGDHVYLDAWYRILSITDRKILYLDGDPADGDYTNPLVVKDNRFLISVDGADPEELTFTVSLPQGTGGGQFDYTAVTPTKITTELNPAGATPTVVGSTVKWTSDTTSGAEAHLSIHPSPLATIFGWPTGAFADGSDGNDQLKLEVDGSSISPITLTGTTAANFVAEIDAVTGIGCTSSGGQLIITSDTYGPLSSLKVEDGSANTPLQIMEDAIYRGKDVSVDDLRDSLAGDAVLGPQVDLLDTRISRVNPGVGASTGGVTLYFNAVDSEITTGDTLVILSGPEFGTFKVVSTTATSIDVDRSLVIGVYTVDVYTHTIALESKDTTVASALTIASGSVATKLGLETSPTRGQVNQVTSTTDLATVDRPPVRIDDRLEVPATEDMNVINISGDVLTLDGTMDNNTSGTWALKARGHAHYNDLIDDLDEWRSDLADSSFSSGLSVLTKALSEALALSSKVLPAVTLLTELDSLFNSLQGELTSFQAARVPSVDEILATLRTRRLDRAADLLSSGRLETFFSITSDEASYKGAALRSMAAAGQEFPRPEGLDLEDERELEFYNPDDDSELDFSDTDGETLDDPYEPILTDDDDVIRIY